jgi:resuscitation-promoting factor RpfA
MAQRAQSRSTTPSSRVSGRGRHRKPSNHTRNLGLATASLVGAIPLATASPASAAGSSWDRLAGCESGQNWNINTGNGYYGGLQFADGTWDGWGGEKYASRADLASKAEQIVIAAKLVENSGWRSWPACSSKLGLDAGDRREALATAEEYKATLNGSQSNGDSTRPAAKDSKPEADSSEKSKPEAEELAEENRSSERATRSKPRKAAPKSSAPKSSAPKSSAPKKAKHRKAESKAQRYVVRRGDTLSAIASKRDVPGGWQALYRINRGKIGSNPGLIFPGQKLRLR